jgi:hypothetical protein
MRCSTAWNWPLTVVGAVFDEDDFSRVAAMTADQRAALSDQFEKASLIAVAVADWGSFHQRCSNSGGSSITKPLLP